MVIKVSIKQHPYEWLSALLLMVYFSPLIFMPNQALFLMHDNLNSNVVWYKRLAESGFLFGPGNASVDFMMGGIPRDCLPTEWNVERLLYFFFSAQTAYSINYILIHTIAFMGMRVLLKNYITQTPIIYNLVALTFACLPFWPSGGLTVAGLPLLIFAFLNIFLKKSGLVDWLIIIIFPFYSFFPIGNMFAFPLIFMFYIWGVFKRKWDVKWLHLFAFFVLISVNLLVEHRIIGLLLSGFESNRLADVANQDSYMNINGILGSAFLGFLFGHYHFHSLHSFIAIITLLCMLIAFIKYKNLPKGLKYCFYLTIMLGVFSLVTLFLNNYDLKSLLGSWFPKVNLRFWVLYPLVWYIIFALLLKFIRPYFPKMIPVLLSVQLAIVFLLLYPRDYFGSRFAENIFANTILYPSQSEQQKWNEYYQVEAFDKLKSNFPDIQKDWVVGFGISPEKLQYNGLNTLEGYYSFYPLDKLYLIRQIDSAERAKAPQNNKIYTNLNYLYVHNIKEGKRPDWNFELLNKQGVRYLISSNEIIDYKLGEIFDCKKFKIF